MHATAHRGDTSRDPAPTDRASALRAAEKLLRTGKLDLAVDEYERLVREDPRDWSTGIHLGTLYLRAGIIGKALEQLTTIADAMYDEKLLSEAASLYATVLTIKHSDEHALLRSADIASAQGQLDEARTHFTTLENARTARGDVRGAAEIRIRLGSLDPNDLEARIVAAHARHDIGDVSGAVEELKAISGEMGTRGRHAEALALLEQAAAYAPDDRAIRECLFATYIRARDFTQARQAASSPYEWKALGLALAKADHPDAVDVLREAVRLNPTDMAIRARLASQFVATGDAAGAAEYLVSEMAGGDAKLLLAIAEIHLRGGKTDSGIAIAQRAVAMDPSLRSHVADLAARAGTHVSEAAWPLLEAVIDETTAASEWAAAAATLEAFVRRVPHCIPALVRLVEVAIDGGLEPIASKAQARLADTYLMKGMGVEALAVIEDLAVRESGDSRHMERFRRALTLVGEENPDEAIARRMNTMIALPDMGGTSEYHSGDGADDDPRVVQFGSSRPTSHR